MTVYGATPIYNYQTYSVRERLILNQAKAGQTSKPVIVTVGVHTLYTMPIWTTPVNADEQLFFKYNVPRRWNGTSDLILGCQAVIDTANTGKKFQLALDWESSSEGHVLAVSSTRAVKEITTGTDAQYMAYDVAWTIDYDAVGGDPILAGDALSGRVRRIAASSAEMTGNPMLHTFYAQFNAHKVGTAI